jgi:hypothetical protein
MVLGKFWQKVHKIPSQPRAVNLLSQTTKMAKIGRNAISIQARQKKFLRLPTTPISTNKT